MTIALDDNTIAHLVAAANADPGDLTDDQRGALAMASAALAVTAEPETDRLIAWAPLRSALHDLAAKDAEQRAQGVVQADHIAGALDSTMAKYHTDYDDACAAIGGVVALSVALSFSQRKIEYGGLPDVVHRHMALTLNPVLVGIARHAPKGLFSDDR